MLKAMSRMIANMRVLLVGLFIVATAATSLYQYYYIWPMQKCEKAGAWWSGKYRQCVTPIPIWRLTGREPGGPKAAAQP